MNDISFILFNPLKDKVEMVPDLPGNYIITLRKDSNLPNIGIDITFHIFQGMNVIYTGLAGNSLRDRDVKKHFNGNAGTSTLRKSLGCLFGYSLIPRDRNFEKNKKTKFNPEDENQLTIWMKYNLLVFYYPNENYKNLEEELILKYNPPLNLDKNHNAANKEFRNELSLLRNAGSLLTISSRPMESINNKTRKINGRGLYVEIWKEIQPFIIAAIRKGRDSKKIGSAIFKNVGNRKNSGYAFRLDISDTAIPLKKGSAVARDLKKVLEANSEFRETAKGKSITIRMNNDCELFVTAS